MCACTARGSSPGTLTLPSGSANLASHLRPSMLCSELTALSASAAAAGVDGAGQQLLRHDGRLAATLQATRAGSPWHALCSFQGPMAATAHSATWRAPVARKVTNPKPRLLPVYFSRMIWASSTTPNWLKCCSSVASSVCHGTLRPGRASGEAT